MRAFLRLRRPPTDDPSGSARRLRRLNLAQLAVLLAGSAAAFAVVLLLVAAIVDGQRDQADVEAAREQLAGAQRSLAEIAADELTGDRDAPRWVPSAVGAAAYRDAAADLRAVSRRGFGARSDGPAESRWTSVAGDRALAATDRLDAVLVPDGAFDSAMAGAELQELRRALDGWTQAFGGGVRDARDANAAATEVLATLCLVILSVLAVGGVWVWVQLDRARDRTMAEMHGAERRSMALAARSSDLVLIVDAVGKISYASPSAAAHLGRPAEELVGGGIVDLVHPDDRPRLGALDGSGERGAPTGPVEWRLLRADGSYGWVESLVSDARGEASVAGWVLNSRDIGDRKAAERQLTRQAFEDELTGLPNRALFADRLRHALAARQRDGEHVAVALIDLDDFKTINDSLGHAAGDLVLRELGARIHESVRPEDTVSRLGGDEFAILVQGVGAHGVRLLAERIVQHLARPVQVDEDRISMQASVGIAFGGDGAADGETLLRNADVAMYAAKEVAGSAVELFRPEMQAAAHERLALKRDLGIAAQRGDLRVVFQPIFGLGDEEVVAFEALLRWNHPEQGSVPPATFIPLAEETGIIHPLGRWVMREACANAARWRAAGADVYVTVNVSSAQLDDRELPRYTAAVLEHTGLATDGLLIEVTESSLPASPERAVATLQRFKDLGLRLAIDDFGTGYSSLSYLASLPVDVVKIDKCFVDGLGEVGRESDLASTILRIGAGLGLRTVAEGIEHPAQAEQLRELGCDLGQGYYYARPLEADAAAALLVAEAGRAARRPNAPRDRPEPAPAHPA